MKSSVRLCLTALYFAALCVALLGATSSVTFAQGVPTLSTGVGKVERIPNPKFSVLIVFAEKKGPLLADIRVTVKDSAGKVVVETTSEGPWLFLGLPAGTYKVEATRRSGEVKTGTVTAPASGQARLAMTW
jgi:hypothetical protein